MKNFLFSLFILTSALISIAPAAKAESPVSVILYHADPKAKEGYAEDYRWRMTRSDEWRRFEYLISKMDVGKETDINPFLKNPDQLLVLSVKDSNGVTGKDYYISKNGIMMTTIGAKSKYYSDEENMIKFLKEELTNRSSFESFPGEKIPPDAKGIVVRFNINENLPNPSWLINKQKDVDLYDSLLRNLPLYNDQYANQLINSNEFNENGTYTLLLNYPKAPAKFATIGVDGIRLSNTFSTDKFFVDDKKYFKYFYNLTLDSRKLQSETQAKDKSIEEKGQF